MENIKRLIAKFNLNPHPEGGFYGQGFRSSEFLRAEQLPERYNAARNLYSSIHFMVTRDSLSKLHQLKTDEMWHFYSGDSIILHLINEQGKYQTFELTNEYEKERYQFLVKKHTWMAASTKGEYSLVGCSLAPGFEFDDFELGSRNKLLSLYPHLEDVITKLT